MFHLFIFLFNLKEWKSKSILNFAGTENHDISLLLVSIIHHCKHVFAHSKLHAVSEKARSEW